MHAARATPARMVRKEGKCQRCLENVFAGGGHHGVLPSRPQEIIARSTHGIRASPSRGPDWRRRAPIGEHRDVLVESLLVDAVGARSYVCDSAATWEIGAQDTAPCRHRLDRCPDVASMASTPSFRYLLDRRACRENGRRGDRDGRCCLRRCRFGHGAHAATQNVAPSAIRTCLPSWVDMPSPFLNEDSATHIPKALAVDVRIAVIVRLFGGASAFLPHKGRHDVSPAPSAGTAEPPPPMDCLVADRLSSGLGHAVSVERCRGPTSALAAAVSFAQSRRCRRHTKVAATALPLRLELDGPPTLAVRRVNRPTRRVVLRGLPRPARGGSTPRTTPRPPSSCPAHRGVRGSNQLGTRVLQRFLLGDAANHVVPDAARKAIRGEKEEVVSSKVDSYHWHGQGGRPTDCRENHVLVRRLGGVLGPDRATIDQLLNEGLVLRDLARVAPCAACTRGSRRLTPTSNSSR